MMITAILGPLEFDNENAIASQIVFDYEVIGAVVLAETGKKGISPFNEIMIEFCQANRISYVVFYAHWDHSDQADKACLANLISCATSAVVFYQGTPAMAQVIGKLQAAKVPTKIIPVGKK